MKFLRTFLLLGAVTWGAASPGVFISWESATNAMAGFGAGPVPADSMLDYWLRMASGAFALVGCLYLTAALSPERMCTMIPLLGWFAVIEGIILLIHGLRLGIGPWPFFGDVAACLVSGGGILACLYWGTAVQTEMLVEPLRRANRRQPPRSV